MAKDEERRTGAPGDSVEPIVYLDMPSIIALHARLFDCSVREAWDRLLRQDALDAALARPLHYAIYEAADLALQAAVLAHGVAESQAFFDGNKRTAVVALGGFVRINGYRLNAPQQQLFQWVLELSPDIRGISVFEFAARLRPHLEAVA